MPMHDDHERTEVGIRTAIGSARVRDYVTTVVQVRGRRAAGFVSPQPVASLAIPMKVDIGRHHQCYQVSFFGTLVLKRRIQQIVRQRGNMNRGALQRRVLLTRGQTWLREGVGTVVRGVIVTVVAELPLAAVVPPGGLIQRAAAAGGRLALA